MRLETEAEQEIMAGLSFTWALRYQGWAFCTIADDHGQAEAIASDITGGPEYFLRAVTSIAQGAAAASAEFEAEGTVFRWLFQRNQADAEIRLVKAADSSTPGSDRIVIWSGRHPVADLALAVLTGFDHAVSELGEDSYRTQWGRAFPRADMEALRAACRNQPDFHEEATW
jgi:hypothetical protein